MCLFSGCFSPGNGQRVGQFIGTNVKMKNPIPQGVGHKEVSLLCPAQEGKVLFLTLAVKSSNSWPSQMGKRLARQGAEKMVYGTERERGRRRGRPRVGCGRDLVLWDLLHTNVGVFTDPMWSSQSPVVIVTHFSQSPGSLLCVRAHTLVCFPL